jgi:hypothetical protein
MHLIVKKTLLARREGRGAFHDARPECCHSHKHLNLCHVNVTAVESEHARQVVVDCTLTVSNPEHKAALYATHSQFSKKRISSPRDVSIPER